MDRSKKDIINELIQLRQRNFTLEACLKYKLFHDSYFNINYDFYENMCKCKEYLTSSEVICRMSSDWSEMYQLSSREFLSNMEEPSKNWLQKYIPPEDQIKVKNTINEVISKKSIFELEHKVWRADGSIGWACSCVVPIINNKGEIVEWFGTARDITEYKRRENHLYFLATITEEFTHLSSADEIIQMACSKVGKFMNATSCILAKVNEIQNEVSVNYSWYAENMSKEIDGQELSSFMIGQLEKNVHDGKNIIIHNTQTDSGIYAGLNTYSYVTLLFHYGGQDKYLFTINQSSARNWLEDEVQLIYEIINRMFLRIERIRSEEALRQSEVKYRTLFENINEGFFLADIICDELGKPIDYMYLAANSALEKIFSMKNEEIIGKRGSEVLAIPNCWIEVLGNVALTGQPVTYEDFLVNVDSHFWIRVYSPAYGQFACLIKDISENKKLDIELKCQKEMFESVIENMHDALIIFNKEGYVIFMNAETRKLYPNMDIQTHISNAFSTFEFFDLKNNVILEEDLPMRRAFRGEKVRNERIITKRPDKIQYTEINATPIFDNKNNLSSLVVCHRDITELIQNQRRVKYKHNQLLRVEKEKRETLQADMKLKDEFLYLITHEFKTPMAVIYSALQAIDFICKDDVTERLGKYLNTIKNNTNRQLRLVNNLLDVTKINSGNIKLSRYNFDIVYVTKFIAKSVEIYAKQKKVNINFKSSIDKKVVYLDEEKFERIMLNLLSNALKFTKEGKSINVLLAIKRYENEDFISISVIDEGIGVQKDNQQMIFERFGQVDTNLSRQAEGTGLGLYLVNLLLKALDGKIFLESEVGKGSNFTVLLPMVKLSQCDETANSSDQNNQLIDGDNRIIRAISIEFSDIYFD